MSDRPVPNTQRPVQIKSLNTQRQTAPIDADENYWNPPPLSNIADTGLNQLAIADLVVKGALLWWCDDRTHHFGGRKAALYRGA